MASEIIAILFAGTVLILPWSLKQAGLFDKVKYWYKVLVSGLLVGLLAVAFEASNTAILLGQDIANQISLGAETITLILVVVSVLGIIKNLLVE